MRRTWLVTLASGLALVTVVALAAYIFNRPSVLRVAVARDSEDARLMAAIQQAFAKDGKNIRLRLTPVNDASASAAAMEAGQADLAVVRSDIAMPPNGQTLVILHRNAAVLMTTASAKIDKVSALKGRKVGVIRATATGRGNLNLLDAVLAQYDVPADSVTRIPLSIQDLPQALRNGDIDALLAVGIASSGSVGEAVTAFLLNSQGPPVFIPISEAGALSQNSPVYEAVEILAGSFGGSPPRPTKNFNTIGVTTRLVGSADLKESVAADLTRYIFAERPVVAQTMPLANKIEPPPTDKGQTFPVHPGAQEYLDGEEQTFLEKNSDVIYLGAMFASVIGSAAAALASRMGARGHAVVEAHLDRLLQLAKLARQAEQPSTLDALEGEVDQILLQALGRDCLKSMEGHRASGFGLALEHVRMSIADQRWALAARPAPRLALAGE